MRTRLLTVAGLLLGVACAARAADIPIDSSTFGGLRARAIGPAVMSGRISAIDAVPGEPLTIWIGSASGGLWRSVDGGVTFQPRFDAHTQSIGAVRVDPTHPQTVWVGTGESWVRNSVSIGDGVYRSDDGGDSWRAMGLAASERIAEILVDPRARDTVFVCATGPAWSAGGERGVFRSTDGGAHWDKVLFVDADTGCSDLAMDPADPRTLYAGMWQFRRYPDFFNSGGPGSGLYRSSDGGTTWTELTRDLPATDKGRIAVAVAPSQPRTVYAVVEAKRTALFRSDDRGDSWREMSTAANVQIRPFYFGELVVDPKDAERVYRPAFSFSLSRDGGKTFTGMFSAVAGGVHPDHHALWIDPRNPQYMLLGTDGGAYVSHDQGAHWRHLANLPVSQFYHVATDDAQPYNVYGGLQDNGSWMGPSRRSGGIRNRDWRSVGYGDGFWTFPDPHQPHMVYAEYQGGKLLRVDRRTDEVKSIAPAADAKLEPLRFNWNTPLLASRLVPGRLYYGAQYLFRSDDRGESWRAISPDLTTDDPKRQRQHASGGLSIDNSSAENNATLYTIAESPLDPDVLWVGSDDGRLHLTRDGGKRWQDVGRRMPGVASGTWISRVEPSPHAAGTVFVTYDGHRTGDFAPYLFRSDDFGATFQRVDTSAVQGYAWVIRQDPENAELLYLGTEQGLFLSLDAGRHWARFSENLPKVAVHDLVFQQREHDLVIATHGRGIYIIDDLTPLRALTAGILAQDVALLPARAAIMPSGGALQEFASQDEFFGENPPESATINYYLRKRHLFGDLLVKVFDAEGKLITTLPGSKRVGLNRVEWPMRLKAPILPPSTQLVPAMVGPRVAEGRYRFELVKSAQVLQGEVQLAPDPRSPHSAPERVAQAQAAMAIYRDLEDLSYLVAAITDLQQQASARSTSAPAPVRKRLDALVAALRELQSPLAATTEGMVSGDQRLRERLGTLYGEVVGYEGLPTATQGQRQQQLHGQVQASTASFESLQQRELDGVNGQLASAGLEPLQPLTRAAWQSRADEAGSGGAPHSLVPWLGVTLRGAAVR